MKAFLFCRYSILRNEQALSGREQNALLRRLRGQRIVYRIRDPEPDQADTYLCKVRSKHVDERFVMTWEMAKDIDFRQKTKYNRQDDDLVSQFEEADETLHAKFISIPELGVMAVEDRVAADALPAKSAIGRFVAAVRALTEGVDVPSIEFAGSARDVDRALRTWSLNRFSFTARPFNPSVRKPGDKLHELLAADHAGKISAVLRPDPSHSMRAGKDGMIEEAKALSDANYGQIGASGTTPSGLRATLTKPKFEIDKEKNAKNQTKSRILKVYVEDTSSEKLEDEAVVAALSELYGE